MTRPGLVAEQRAEGLALVDEAGSLTDVAMPAEGTDAHVTLLVAEFLATVYRQWQTDATGATQPFGRLTREQDVTPEVLKRRCVDRARPGSSRPRHLQGAKAIV